MSDRSSAAPPAPPGAARRNPRVMLLGVMLMALGAVGGAALYVQAGEHSSVLALTRDVVRGDTVSSADLEVVEVGHIPGRRVVAASRLDEVAGQLALSDLQAGALVAPGMIGEAEIPPGRVRMGLRLDEGRVPATGLPDGARVEAVRVGAPGAGDGPAGRIRARVLATRGDQASGTLLVDVELPVGQARVLAVWAASEQVALLRVREF